MSRDHIVVLERDLSVHCQRCGAVLKIALPVNLNVWLVAAEEFGRLHAGCPQTGTATSQTST